VPRPAAYYPTRANSISHVHKMQLSARRITQLARYTDTNDSLRAQYLADSAALVAHLEKAQATLVVSAEVTLATAVAL
jgi:hypothetical protein